MYLITATEMTTSGFGVDAVSSVGWTWNNPTFSPSAQSIPTTGTLKIYLQSTTDASYTKGTVFSTAGMTKVYDGTISIPATFAAIILDMPVGGPGTSTFTTIAGQGVYVAFEYHTTTSLATPTGAPTVDCDASITGSLGTYQSQTVNGTAMSLSAFRPATRFGSATTDILQMTGLYTLGATSTPFGNAQPMQAVVSNLSGVDQAVDVTFNVYEKATMTLRHTAMVSTTILALSSATFDDLTWNATLTELDTVIASATIIVGETATTNNSKGYRHEVTTDRYNYSDISVSSSSVGFATGEGIICNRYHISGCSNVRQVRVFIKDPNTAFNTVYGVVLNSVGDIVGTSADYIVMPIDIDTYVTFDITTPPNFTDEDVYVGIAQTANVDIGYFPVGVQIEPFPARNNAYCATALAGGLPAAYTTLGRFMIEGVITGLSTTPTNSGDVEICAGEFVDISVTGGVLNPFATYHWYTDGCGTTEVGTGSTITVSPGSETTYYVRAEDPCNGMMTDCSSLTVSVDTPTPWYPDSDGDGYGADVTATMACEMPVGYIADNTDCDDGHFGVNPGATEVCNDIDDDCNTLVDDGLSFDTWYADADDDGYGDAGVSESTCDGAPTGFVGDDTDCDDTDENVNPGATEVCANAIDDDCDGSTDEDCTLYTFYFDADEDTYGDVDVFVTNYTGIAPIGYVADGTDCDDTDPDIHPGATEICNGLDEDCDAIADNDLTFDTWYADSDGDGYGDAGTSASTCDGAPSGYVADATDCNDGNDDIHPGATELCNGIDDDCDGFLETGITAVITPGGPTSFCTGSSVTLFANTGDGYTYQWKNLGSPIPGATNSSLVVTKTGTLTVVITVGACTDVSDPVSTTKNPKPNSVVINADATNDLCFDASIKLKANLAGGVTYQWYKGGTPLAGATNFLYFATVQGNYKILLTAIATGCNSMSAPYSIIQTCKEGDVVNTELSIYPNPTSGEFMIDATIGTTSGMADLMIYNAVGEMIYTTQLETVNGNIHQFVQPGQLSSGIYIVQVTDGTDLFNTRLIVSE